MWVTTSPALSAISLQHVSSHAATRAVYGTETAAINGTVSSEAEVRKEKWDKKTPRCTETSDRAERGSSLSVWLTGSQTRRCAQTVTPSDGLIPNHVLERMYWGHLMSHCLCMALEISLFCWEYMILCTKKSTQTSSSVNLLSVDPCNKEEKYTEITPLFNN